MRTTIHCVRSVRSLRSFSTALTLGLVALTACDNAYDPGALAIDPNAPKIRITKPERGEYAGEATTVTVSGTVHDDVGVTGVTVNGVAATVSPNGTFTAEVPVAPGTQLLHAIASDADGNQGKETRAVSSGPVRSITTQVPKAVLASISAQTFDAVGRGATNFIQTADLTAMIAPANPVVRVGGDDPDCLFGHASITDITFGDVAIELRPMAGGLYLQAELVNPYVGMHLDYAAACVDGSRDISIAATKITVAGLISLSIKDGKLESKIVNPEVQITTLDLELGGIPGDVVNLIRLDQAIGPIIGWATERFVAPVIAEAIMGATESQVDVLGTTVDVKLSPSRLEFDVTGAIVELDTQLRAQGDSLLTGFVYVPNTPPTMSTENGFEVALSDDAVNQLLTSLWTAKAFDKAFDLDTGSYGEVGKLYDRVEISVKAPPFVDAGAGTGLVLTLGDLMVSFKHGTTLATQVSVNAQITLKATTTADGAVRLDAGVPTVFVDILDDGVEGANDLSRTDFEKIVSFALSRAVSMGSGAVGAIPMPSAGGVSLTDLAVSDKAGYLVIDGRVE